MINRGLKIQQAYGKLNNKKGTISELSAISQSIENKYQKKCLAGTRLEQMGVEIFVCTD
jgi:hypothetical protein